MNFDDWTLVSSLLYDLIFERIHAITAEYDSLGPALTAIGRKNLGAWDLNPFSGVVCSVRRGRALYVVCACVRV